jgi:hypothetical protein
MQRKARRGQNGPVVCFRIILCGKPVPTFPQDILYLRQASVGEDFAAGHEAAVGGGEERGHRRDLDRVNGKTAVITGGGTGIGFASAQRFIEEGAFVYIFGRRQELLDAAAERAVQGVSDKMLIHYRLTELGHSLAQALAPLCNWGSDNMDAVARIFAERDGWAGRQAS